MTVQRVSSATCRRRLEDVSRVPNVRRPNILRPRALAPRRECIPVDRLARDLDAAVLSFLFGLPDGNPTFLALQQRSFRSAARRSGGGVAHGDPRDPSSTGKQWEAGCAPIRQRRLDGAGVSLRYSSKQGLDTSRFMQKSNTFIIGTVFVAPPLRSCSAVKTHDAEPDAKYLYSVRSKDRNEEQ